MPLYFEEIAPDPKAKKDGKKGSASKARPVATTERTGPAPAAQHLDSQIVPTLVRKVGDWKSGRISQAQCESYLERHTLVFDRELLTKMFTEADFQKEGSLDTRALTIAISGRFPKREHTADWRALAALLLGLSELVLTEDAEAVATLRSTHERPSGGGTYNSGNIWDGPPPALPAVRRRTPSGRSGSGRVAEPSPEWEATMRATAAAAAASGTSTGPGSVASSSGGAAGPGPGSLEALLAAASSGGLGMTMRGGGLGLGLGSLVATTGGLKAGTQVAEEGRINAQLAEAGGTATFATQRDFNDFSRGLELLPSLAADSASPGPGSATAAAAAAAAEGPRTATRLGEPRAAVRVWAAALPPSAISLPPSALAGLRGSVRATASAQPDFARSFRPLDSHDLAQKRVLGEPLDVSSSLARVEPVRGTHVLNRDDYVAWGDYAAGCRTAPAGWDSRHPAAAAQDAGGHRYPWC